MSDKKEEELSLKKKVHKEKILIMGKEISKRDIFILEMGEDNGKQKTLADVEKFFKTLRFDMSSVEIINKTLSKLKEMKE